MRTVLTLIVVGFCLFCGILVIESGLFENTFSCQAGCILLQQTAPEQKTATTASSRENAQLQVAQVRDYGADHAPARSITIGAEYPKTENADTGFKIQVELSSKGAAIKKVTFSNGPDSQGRPTGFDDRDYENPSPLVLLSPAGRTLSMVNKEFVFVEEGLQLRLNELHWQSFEVETDYDGSETACFETVITEKATGEPVIKIVKTYKIRPGSYDVECSIAVENLSGVEQKTSFSLGGPVGIRREGTRSDNRKVVAAFRNAKGQVVSGRSARLNLQKLRKAKSIDDRRLQVNGDPFLWAAITNKYFAAVLVSLPDEGKEFCEWIKDESGGTSKPGQIGHFYNPDGDSDAKTGDETVGLELKIAKTTLAPTGTADSKKEYNFVLYLGPKDKTLFDKNKLYRELGFVQTIDFLACCCPTSIISPLAFGILTLMRWMYSFIGNYGIVIIILVFLIRICIHPLSKKSQVSMSKFSKLAPKMEQIKKKYANNKAEMTKHITALYKEQGASPISGMLPMFVQMPIWVALYSAIYASIELRGAAFLPFWITDLSVPDALIRFKAFSLPLFGEINSFNLLPILMGVAFYMQQKLMPQQPVTSPQAAQQQKMMKIMFPLLFPLMLYKAPSGLNLYIMSSVFAGAVEQHLIRKHIREKEEAESQGLVPVTSKTGGKVKKKKPKPFFKTR